MIKKPLQKMKFNHFNEFNKKYARGSNDIRLSIKRYLPWDYLNECAPMEQYWFRGTDPEAIAIEQENFMRIEYRTPVVKDRRFIGDFHSPNIQRDLDGNLPSRIRLND